MKINKIAIQNISVRNPTKRLSDDEIQGKLDDFVNKVCYSFLSSPDFRGIIKWAWGDENDSNGEDIYKKISNQKSDIKNYLKLFSELKNILEPFKDDKTLMIRVPFILNKEVSKETLSNMFIPIFEKIKRNYDQLFDEAISRADSPVGVNDNRVIVGIASIQNNYEDQLHVWNHQTVQIFPYKEFSTAQLFQAAIVLSSVLYFLNRAITDR